MTWTPAPGAAALSARTLPRWAALALVAGSAAFFDTVPSRAWFAPPYGAAWVAVAYLMSVRGGLAAEQPSRVR